MFVYSENDFCDTDSGLDYVFGYMGAIYGASFSRHWDGMDLGLVRQVWKETLGRYLTYQPILEFALKHMNPDFPPSALKFKQLCDAAPDIPRKPVVAITQQKTQAEIAETERQKKIALERLEQLKRDMKTRI